MVGKLLVEISLQLRYNTYTYYGEVYVSNLTGPEISKIQDCLDTGKWTSSFDKLKHICVDLGIVRF